jgi:hypothetical protein
LTVTKAFVALVLTAAFEFFRPVFRNSIRLRMDNPAIPNSVRAVSIQAVASAITFGAFCFDSGSYATHHFSHI